VNEQPGQVLYGGPVVVLENKLTASASEIFSAAMQDRQRAAIVGNSGTFGKGTIQAVVEIDRLIEQIGDRPNLGGALKVTIEKIYRVTGHSTQVKGVTGCEDTVADRNNSARRRVLESSTGIRCDHSSLVGRNGKQTALSGEIADQIDCPD